MPLSDEELRLLEQMEKALAAEDPRFASVLAGDFRRGGRLRLAAASLVTVVGVALLVGGVVIQQPWVGVAGFVVAVLGATMLIAFWRGVPTRAARRPRAPKQQGLRMVQGGRSSSAFMQRVEARWLRRRHRWS